MYNILSSVDQTMMFMYSMRIPCIMNVVGGGRIAFFFLSGSPTANKMTSKRTCILHIHGKTTEEVKPFDDNTWRKVNSVHEKRHSTVKKTQSISE